MKKSVYQIVTEQIIQALEAGLAPWRKPWRDAGAHSNGLTKNKYRGINPLLLECAALEHGYTAPVWLTFNQIKKLGGNVKGQKAAGYVVFTANVDCKTGEQNSDGSEEVQSRFVHRYSRVFNIEQTGLPYEAPTVEEIADPLAEGEAIINNMPQRPELVIKPSSRAFYIPAQDKVVLPELVQFEEAEAFYRTAFHELAHSTGHPTRLNRKMGKKFGSDPYAREELVAEITAAMVSHKAGISTDHDTSAAYCQSWAEKLRGDSRLIITAASQAQKAADYILGESK